MKNNDEKKELQELIEDTITYAVAGVLSIILMLTLIVGIVKLCIWIWSV